MSYDPKRRPNHQKMDEQLYENGAFFISTLQAFQKSNCRISGKIGFYKMPIEFSYNIDTMEDLDAVKRMMGLLKKWFFQNVRMNYYRQLNIIWEIKKW